MSIGAYRYVIVGSGFLGSVVAERIATQLRQPVLVLEKRNHIGGNCHSAVHAGTGIEYHTYGTHIFHTSNEKVWKYINQFTTFNSYRHQVLTTWRGRVYQLPINLETINSFYGINLRPYEVDSFLQQEVQKSNVPPGDSMEAYAIRLMGRPLYEAFIEGYTQKQWQAHPSTLPASLINRLPFRKNYDESYYHSRYQGIPLHGYTAIFEKMLQHPLINVRLQTDFFAVRQQLHSDALIVYSGPVDRLFDYCYGPLRWRTLRFEQEVVPYEDYQGTSVMNYAEAAIPYTRIHEPRHLHPERNYTRQQSLIIREYPATAGAADEPFYSIPDAANQELVLRYRALAEQTPNLLVAGRLGDYRYYDMHETIARALELFETRILPQYA
ncbi:MAG: UDP-galactopyranose mutase [Lacibacter sp.]